MKSRLLYLVTVVMCMNGIFKIRFFCVFSEFLPISNFKIFQVIGMLEGQGESNSWFGPL